MVLLQPKLSLKVSQRQILTPGLVQMVSVLALNKFELRDMITAELVENPVLEELEDSVPLLDDVNRREEDRERTAATATEESPVTPEKKDPFEEIDFGSFFQEYLDPGYRSQGEMEEIERPSFENFLSKPGNLTDHLMWQLGALGVSAAVREAAEQVIGNLNEDGYLIATDEELLGITPPVAPEVDAAAQENLLKEATALGLESPAEAGTEPAAVATDAATDAATIELSAAEAAASELAGLTLEEAAPDMAMAATEAPAPAETAAVTETPVTQAPPPESRPLFKVNFNLAQLHEAIQVVQQMDPPGVGCRGLRECLLNQLQYHKEQYQQSAHSNGNGATEQLLA